MSNRSELQVNSLVACTVRRPGNRSLILLWLDSDGNQKRWKGILYCRLRGLEPVKEVTQSVQRKC